MCVCVAVVSVLGSLACQRGRDAVALCVMMLLECEGIRDRPHMAALYIHQLLRRLREETCQV